MNKLKNSDSIQTISFIGAGNVATQMAKNLYQKGFKIKQIYSRTEASAVLLSQQVEANFTTSLKEISSDVNLIVISVNDKALIEITPSLDLGQTLTVHTGGSIPMSQLEGVSSRIGVIYPLQTFTKSHDISFEKLPLCVEANNEKDLKDLLSLSKRLSTKVASVSSKQRKTIHLAAVFACNFSNHMLAIADEILTKEDLELGLLQPLVEETITKAFTITPKKGQSGPAIRRDDNVINEHLKRLEKHPDFSDIYKKISNSIQNI